MFKQVRLFQASLTLLLLIVLVFAFQMSDINTMLRGSYEFETFVSICDELEDEVAEAQWEKMQYETTAEIEKMRPLYETYVETKHGHATDEDLENVKKVLNNEYLKMVETLGKIIKILIIVVSAVIVTGYSTWREKRNAKDNG